LILVVALIVFGPRRLPEIGKSMGKMLAEFRKASNDFKRTIEDELEAEKARDSAPPAPPLVEPATAPPVVTPPVEAPALETPPVETTAAETPPVETTPPPAVAAEPRLEPPAEAVVSRGAATEEK